MNMTSVPDHLTHWIFFYVDPAPGAARQHFAHKSHSNSSPPGDHGVYRSSCVQRRQFLLCVLRYLFLGVQWLNRGSLLLDEVMRWVQNPSYAHQGTTLAFLLANSLLLQQQSLSPWSLR